MLNARAVVAAATLVVASGAMNAYAAKPEQVPTIVAEPQPIISAQPHAPTSLATGFESPFAPGTINGQQGWTVSTISSVPVTGESISTTTPIAGAQSLKTIKSTAASAGTTVGAFSPVAAQTAPDASLTSFSMRVDGVTPGSAGGADYYVSGQTPAQAFVSWRVNFNYLGPIRVLDYPGVGQTGTLSYVNTGVNWTPGTQYDISVAFVPSPTALPGATTATGSIVYSINGVPVYTADSLVAGTTVDQYVVTNDSFQVSGESMTFDNLNVAPVPEPTSLALIGLGAAAVLRRRSR